MVNVARTISSQFTVGSTTNEVLVSESFGQYVNSGYPCILKVTPQEDWQAVDPIPELPHPLDQNQTYYMLKLDDKTLKLGFTQDDVYNPVELPFTVNSGASELIDRQKVSILAHPFKQDELLQIESDDPPAPLVSGNTYYIEWLNPDTIGLKEASDDPLIEFTTDGTGTHLALQGFINFTTSGYGIFTIYATFFDTKRFFPPQQRNMALYKEVATLTNYVLVNSQEVFKHIVEKYTNYLELDVEVATQLINEEGFDYLLGAAENFNQDDKRVLYAYLKLIHLLKGSTRGFHFALDILKTGLPGFTYTDKEWWQETPGTVDYVPYTYKIEADIPFESYGDVDITKLLRFLHFYVYPTLRELAIDLGAINFLYSFQGWGGQIREVFRAEFTFDPVALGSIFWTHVESSQIFTMKEDGSDVFDLSQNTPINEIVLDVNPSLSKILFQSDSDGDNEIYLADVDIDTGISSPVAKSSGGYGARFGRFFDNGNMFVWSTRTINSLQDSFYHFETLSPPNTNTTIAGLNEFKYDIDFNSTIDLALISNRTQSSTAPAQDGFLTLRPFDKSSLEFIGKISNLTEPVFKCTDGLFLNDNEIVYAKVPSHKLSTWDLSAWDLMRAKVSDLIIPRDELVGEQYLGREYSDPDLNPQQTFWVACYEQSNNVWRYEIMKRSLSGGTFYRVTEYDGTYNDTFPCWREIYDDTTPEERILFSRQTISSGLFQIYWALPDSPYTLTNLTNSSDNERFPCVNHAGNKIYFTSNVGDTKYNLYKADISLVSPYIENKALIPLDNVNDIFFVRISYDDTYLGVLEIGTTKLRIINLTTETYTTYDFGTNVNGFGWDVDTEKFYFVLANTYFNNKGITHQATFNKESPPTISDIKAIGDGSLVNWSAGIYDIRPFSEDRFLTTWESSSSSSSDPSTQFARSIYVAYLRKGITKGSEKPLIPITKADFNNIEFNTKTSEVLIETQDQFRGDWSIDESYIVMDTYAPIGVGEDSTDLVIARVDLNSSKEAKSIKIIGQHDVGGGVARDNRGIVRTVSGTTPQEKVIYTNFSNYLGVGSPDGMWWVNPDGTDEYQLIDPTSPYGSINRVDVTQDGTKIVFQAQGSDIYIGNISTDAPPYITGVIKEVDNPEDNLTKDVEFSKDGNYIAYVRMISGAEEIHVRNLSTGLETVLVQVTNGNYLGGLFFDWEDEYLYWHYAPNANSCIIRRCTFSEGSPPVLGSVESLLPIVSGVYSRYPVPSRDGKRIMFSHNATSGYGNTGGAWRMFIGYFTDTTNTTSTKGINLNPDKTFMIYHSDKNGANDLYKLELDTLTETRMTNDAVNPDYGATWR